jgi:mannose/fructose/N-acetylgalactosamine-specific phosphotransferase system component IID
MVIHFITESRFSLQSGLRGTQGAGRRTAEKLPANLQHTSQTSFASTGDLLFWHTIRPALLLCAVILGLKIGIAGPVTAFLVYNILHLYYRVQGLRSGYEKGTDIIYVLGTKPFTLVQRIFEFIGALTTGGLITLVTTDFNALLVIPLCLIFTGLLLKRIASVIITIIAIIVTMIIVLV